MTRSHRGIDSQRVVKGLDPEGEIAGDDSWRPFVEEKATKGLWWNVAESTGFAGCLTSDYRVRKVK